MRVYCDGATSNNGHDGAVGGWAFLAIEDEDTTYLQGAGRIENTTNNVCELTAVYEACAAVAKRPGTFTVYSDSAYIVNCYKDKWYKKWMQNGWVNSKKEPVANRELWELLIPYFEDERFSFEKIKAHAGHKWNEEVDRMAVRAKEGE